MKNQRGMVSLDYLFAFVLVGGFSFLIMALSLSLSVVEIVQYMTFASARTFYAGNIDPVKQSQLGRAKFISLQEDPILAPFFRNGWFAIDMNTLRVGALATNPNPDLAQYKRQDPSQDLFHGTVVALTLNALDFNVPFFGSTSAGAGQNGNKKPFQSYIGSYLGRETTFNECENFMLDRLPAIKDLKSNSPAQPYSSVNMNVNAYIPSDNGC